MPIHSLKPARLICAAFIAFLLSIPCQSYARPPYGFVGVNCANWDKHLDSPKVEKLLKAAGVTALRWPGGSGADNFDWTKPPEWAVSTARFNNLAKALGAQVTITTNYGSGSPQMAAAWVAYCNGTFSHDVKIGLDSTGRDWRSSAYWVKLRQSKPLAADDGLNVLRVHQTQPYGFENWEIGNECYGSWESDHHAPAHDPALYAAFCVQAAKLMRQLDPDIRIGVVVTGIDRPVECQESVFDPIIHKPTSEWTPLVLSALSNHGMRPDFLAYHHYALDPGHESDEQLFRDYANLPAISSQLNALSYAYFPSPHGKKIGIACTECNSVTFNPGPQTTGEANAIYYSEVAEKARELGFENVIWWDLHNAPNKSGYDTHSSLNRFNYGDYGILGSFDRQDIPYPVYYAMKRFGAGQ